MLKSAKERLSSVKLVLLSLLVKYIEGDEDTPAMGADEDDDDEVHSAELSWMDMAEVDVKANRADVLVYRLDMSDEWTSGWPEGGVPR